MKRPLILLLAATAAASVPAVAAAKSSILFSVTASSATITKSGKAYAVTLPARSPMAWFTDRPERNAGNGTLWDIAGAWAANEFDTNPPNAALVTGSGARATQTIVVLTRPRGSRNGRVTLTARPLMQGSMNTMMGGMSTKTTLRTGRVGDVSLFIDTGNPPCNGGSFSYRALPSPCTLAAGAYAYFGVAPNQVGFNLSPQACTDNGSTQTISASRVVGNFTNYVNQQAAPCTTWSYNATQQDVFMKITAPSSTSLTITHN